MTAGMAYEAMNNCGLLKKNMIVVLNDNNMSISKNVGGISINSNLSKLSAYVSRLTTTRFYRFIRGRLDRGIQGIPILGYKLFELFVRLKRTVKAALLKETMEKYGFASVRTEWWHYNLVAAYRDPVSDFRWPCFKDAP